MCELDGEKHKAGFMWMSGFISACVMEESARLAFVETVLCANHTASALEGLQAAKKEQDEPEGWQYIAPRDPS